MVTATWISRPFGRSRLSGTTRNPQRRATSSLAGPQQGSGSKCTASGSLGGAPAHAPAAIASVATKPASISNDARKLRLRCGQGDRESPEGAGTPKRASRMTRTPMRNFNQGRLPHLEQIGNRRDLRRDLRPAVWQCRFSARRRVCPGLVPAARACGLRPLPLLSRVPRAGGQARPFSNARRRGAGVVERDGLENRYTLTGIEGSNPSPSAIFTCRLPIYRK